MAQDPFELAAFDFIFQVERFYASLISRAESSSISNAEPDLGGKLLYVGELDERGRALLVAGNIAGAASLAATVDQAAQKQAVRDGVADFLVNSLDETLRILKNQIRKHETVAVCVALSPEAIELEMLERGVLPDLLRPADEASNRSPFSSQGARHLPPPIAGSHSTLLMWRVAAAPAQWLPKLDAVAFNCFKHDDWPTSRWLRLAPRYFGRLAKGLRFLFCDQQFAAEFIEQVRQSVEHGEIGVEVQIQVRGEGACDNYQFAPRRGSSSSG